MNYVELDCSVEDAEKKEMLIALLENEGFSGFEETATGMLAYIEEGIYDGEAVQGVMDIMNVSYTTKTIQPRNWNEEWEKNFSPVVINGFCMVRAAFHPKDETVKYDIVITPKMSFGTGHHATTRLMMQQMSQLDLQGKTVFDFGTGTGILAILGEMLGAEDTLAIDNDEWAYRNTLENIETNNVHKIQVLQGSIEGASGRTFDVILANINRHILLDNMQQMYDSLNAGGNILMSGILTEDKEIVVNAAEAAGFKLINSETENNWVVLLLNKL